MKNLLFAIGLLAPGLLLAQGQPEIRLYFADKDLACGDPISKTAPNSGDDTLTRSFPIAAYDWSASQQLNIGSASAGAGAGKVDFAPLKLQRFSDACSPLLFVKEASGSSFAKMRLVFFDPAKNARMIIELRVVAISTLYVSGGASEPAEALSLEFGGVTMQVNTVDNAGKLVLGQPVGWDRIRNTRL